MADMMASGLLTDDAEAEGKITIGSEFGCGESVNRQGTAHADEGIKNVLRRHHLVEEPIPKIDPERRTPTRFLSATKLGDYVPYPSDGIWEPVIGPGDDVDEGRLIGRLHDLNFHAKPALEIRAPRKGTVTMMHFPATPNKGDALFALAQVVQLQYRYSVALRKNAI